MDIQITVNIIINIEDALRRSILNTVKREKNTKNNMGKNSKIKISILSPEIYYIQLTDFVYKFLPSRSCQ